ncbi:MAG: hypothetical protein J6C97_03525, partial [Clostridia bacterium]|nr:hypothetical protein [Clostridia bacterium]
MKRIIIVFFMVLLALSFGACFGKDNYSSTALSSVSSQQANSSISQDSSSSQKESDSSIKSTAISSLESSSSEQIISSSSIVSSSSSQIISSFSGASSSSSEPIFSSDTSFMLSSVFGFNVANDTISVKPIEYDNIVANKNAIIQNSVYTLADKASVVASLKEDLKNITFVITAEDGTTATYVLSIAIEDLFDTYGNGLGNANGFVWDSASATYITNYGGATEIASGLYYKGDILSGNYLVSMDLSLSNLTADATFMLIARVSDTVRIRYIIRATSDTQIEVASDYNDGYKDLDYTVHVSAFTYLDKINIGVVVKGTDVAMLFNGEIVYHRGLEELSLSQMVVSASGSMQVSMDNIVLNNSATQVLAEYTECIKNYRDAIVGNTIGQTHNLNKVEQDLNSGTVKVNMANTTTGGPMVSFRYNGNPVAGYNFAVTGNIRVVTVSGKSGHVVFMAYQDMDNVLRYFINRNDSPNNTCYYRINDNGVWSPSQTTNTMCP